MWQVGLALFAKGVLCIFTFGIKVCSVCVWEGRMMGGGDGGRGG